MKKRILSVILAMVISSGIVSTAFAVGDDTVSPLAAGDTGALVKQESSFTKSFEKEYTIYTIDKSIPLGTLTYGYKQRSVLSDYDYAQCWTEFDWNHSSMVITGIGSGKTNTKNSGTLITHGVTTAKLDHKGPKVSYGGEITAV